MVYKQCCQHILATVNVTNYILEYYIHMTVSWDIVRKYSKKSCVNSKVHV